MIAIDYKDSRPIYEQVTEKLKILILKGVLAPGDQMPSVRNMAIELSINPNTIQRSFTELEREGYIYAVKGRGNFVADTDELLTARRVNIRKEILDKVSEAGEYGVSVEEIIEDIQKENRHD